MRAAKSAGSLSRATSFWKRSFGIDVGDHALRAHDLAARELDAGRPAAVDDHARDGDAVSSTTPRTLHSAAIACVIAPMPPRACPIAHAGR
jgi:hypothetical protein